MTVTITKTINLKALSLDELKAMPQEDLAEILFEHIQENKSKNTHTEIINILQELEDVVNISDQDFMNFGYTKSQEMLEQERIARRELNTISVEIESDAFSEWKVKYWEKLELLEDLFNDPTIISKHLKQIKAAQGVRNA